MRIANNLIQNGTSKHVSRIIWFRTGLQITYRESFDSEWDYKARIANHLIQNGLQSAYCESFDSERDFKVRIANHLIQNWTSKHIS